MSTSGQAVDQRGTGKRLKAVLPTGVFRALTVTYNGLMSMLPDGVKYGIGGMARRRKHPYSLLRADDVVVQIGAPRDTLAAGRSRAIHFSRVVSEGQVVVIEPDDDNFAALTRFIARHGLEDRVTVFHCGAWSEATELTFLSSPNHPAANVLEGVHELTEEQIAARNYERITITVRSVDDILAEAGVGTPRLVSITTNGAELQILEGMRQTIDECAPFISLAHTGEGYVRSMSSLGYECLARDDRGFTFEHRGPGR